MCGITGFVDFTTHSSSEILDRMTETLVHRGPDDRGTEILRDSGALIGFGFRRLSILELSQLGHQPMFSEDKKIAIVFNGEIYNYKDIRKELEKDGVHFVSNSDTEVILKAYEKWGTECVKKFIGMFAIALTDLSKRKFFLFRDRAGVKPLFYSWKNNLFLFGSELKALNAHPGFVKTLDSDALSLFFRYGYISAPYCIFKDTYKLLPGHFLELDLTTKSFSIKKYWDVYDFYNQPKLKIPYQDAVDELEKILSSSFEYRMISDVPVGVFLSGGYDSSAVTALLQKNSVRKIKTFTIGFTEDKYNEAHHAKKVAEHVGTEHHELYCTFQEAQNIVPQLPEIYDEPMGDSSAIPTVLVSRMARKDVTVALSADGGDEIFAGYPKYFRTEKFLSLKKKFPAFVLKTFGSVLPELKGYSFSKEVYEKLRVGLIQNNPTENFHDFLSVMSLFGTDRLIEKKIVSLTTPFNTDYLINLENDSLSRMQAIDFKTFLVDDILQKVDRATMSASLEGREPFLDQRIIEFVARLPASYKFQNGKGKRILREIVHRYVPSGIMDRPKMGFMVPVESWCKNELKSLLLHFTDEKKIKDQGILNHVEVKKMVDTYLSGRKINFQKIWFLLMFQMWYERWMGGSR